MMLVVIVTEMLPFLAPGILSIATLAPPSVAYGARVGLRN
jgi:hypothetical protein